MDLRAKTYSIGLGHSADRLRASTNYEAGEEMARAMEEVPGVSTLIVKYLLRNLNRIQFALLDHLSDPEASN
jgi:hypothetical protein